MALLVIELDKQIGNAKAWRDTFEEQLPDLEIRIWPDAGKLEDIEYLAFMHPDFDVSSDLSESESHVQPLGRGRVFYPASQAAEGPAMQGRAARRRSDDDGIRRHARSSFSS